MPLSRLQMADVWDRGLDAAGNFFLGKTELSSLPAYEIAKAPFR
jgi:hypothetical protein